MKSNVCGKNYVQRLVGVFLGSVLACSCALAQQNVVLVILDTCRADAVNASRDGVPLMPNLSSWDALQLPHAYASAPATVPSMPSIFTGLHVGTHQAFFAGQPFPEALEGIGEYFKSLGYATFGVQTNGNLTAELGYAAGFDQYIYQSHGPADWVTQTALSLIEEADTPFFLYVHYMEPHVPYEPPTAYQTLMGYPDPMLSSAELSLVEDFVPYHLDFLRYHLGLQPELGYPQLSPLGQDAVRQLYDGEVRFNDDQLALLLSAIDTDYPDSFSIVTADHGEHFWEHNSLGHTTTLYEQLVHVPLIIKAPGLPAAAPDAMVSLVDLLPTIASHLHLPVRTHWEGRDIFAPRDPGGPVYSSCKNPYTWLRNLDMIRLGDWKLIQDFKTGQSELFHVASDPGELTDRSEDDPATLQLLTQFLHVHLLQTARANGPDANISVLPGRNIVEGASVQLVGPAGYGHIWFKDGWPIENDPPYITGVHARTLIIQDATALDSGQYECICSNDMMERLATYPFTLDVQAPNAVPNGGLAFLAVSAALIALGGCRYLRASA